MTRIPGSLLDGAASVARLCRWLRAPDDVCASARFTEYYDLHRQPLMRMLERKLVAAGGESVREQTENGYQELMQATCQRLTARHDRLLRTHLLLKTLELPTANDVWRQRFIDWRKAALLAVGGARWLIHDPDDPGLLQRIDDLNNSLSDLSSRAARLLVQRLNEAAVALADSKGVEVAEPGRIAVEDPSSIFQAVLGRPSAERARYLVERFPGWDRPALAPIRQSLCDFGEVLVHLGKCRLPTVGYLVSALDNIVIDQLRDQRRDQITLDDWERLAGDRDGSDAAGPDRQQALADDDQARAHAALRFGAGHANRSALWFTIEKLLRRRQREIEAQITSCRASAAVPDPRLEARLADEVARNQRAVSVLLLQAMDYGQEEVAALLRLSRDQVRTSQAQGRRLSLEILHYWLQHFRDLPAIQTRLGQWGPGADDALRVLRALFDGSDDERISRELSLPEDQVRRWRRRIGEVASDLVAGWIHEALLSRSSTDSVLRQLNADECLVALRKQGKVERHD